MEQFIDADETRRYALLVMVTQKCREHVTIGVQTARPEVRPHQRTRLGQSFFDKR